jgi:hypothetical protein
MAADDATRSVANRLIAVRLSLAFAADLDHLQREHDILLPDSL